MFSHEKMQIQRVHLSAVSLAKTKTQTTGAVEDAGRVALLTAGGGVNQYRQPSVLLLHSQNSEPQPVYMFLNR